MVKLFRKPTVNGHKCEGIRSSLNKTSHLLGHRVVEVNLATLQVKKGTLEAVEVILVMVKILVEEEATVAVLVIVIEEDMVWSGYDCREDMVWSWLWWWWR